ncbi:hypothetical protein OK006_10181 [Actinobacteria bacterium OK006]|nr:hypothetical protein OK006_10181 [Actinobacteria bacterium OK006]
MAEAAETTIGVNPDRVSFTVALEAARDQLITAESVLPGTPGPGVIAQAALAALLPKRRTRISARKVKSALSRYPGNPADERPLTSQNSAHLAIAIYAAHPSSPTTDTSALRHRLSPGARADATTRCNFFAPMASEHGASKRSPTPSASSTTEVSAHSWATGSRTES